MYKQERDNTTAYKDVIAISFGVSIVAMFVTSTFYLMLGNALFLFICLEFGAVRNAVSRGWRAFTHVLGVINSTILLSLIFFLIFFPIAMLRRVFSKRKSADPNSTFVVVEKQYSREDLENMW